MAVVNTYAREEAESTSAGPVYVDTGRARVSRANLYPPGRAYVAAFVDGTNMSLFNIGLARETERVEQEVRAALAARDPREAYAYLADWEEALSLPDTASASLDPADRRVAAYQKLVGPGGQSPDFLIQVAEDLGYVIEVEHSMYDDAHFCGNYAATSAMCGDATCAGVDIGHFLIIHVKGSGDDPQLEAAITRYLHPHAVVTFLYDL